MLKHIFYSAWQSSFLLIDPTYCKQYFIYDFLTQYERQNWKCVNLLRQISVYFINYQADAIHSLICDKKKRSFSRAHVAIGFLGRVLKEGVFQKEFPVRRVKYGRIYPFIMFLPTLLHSLLGQLVGHPVGKSGPFYLLQLPPQAFRRHFTAGFDSPHQLFQ